jgi:cytochrome b involved in lipid metabolism
MVLGKYTSAFDHFTGKAPQSPTTLATSKHIMEFYNIRQTPSFGLISPGKHTVMPDTSHIEHLNEQPKGYRSDHEALDGKHHDRDDQHNRNRHHVHFPFHRRTYNHNIPLHENRQSESVSDDLPYIPATEVEKADGKDGSPICKFSRATLQDNNPFRCVYIDRSTGVVIDNTVYDVTSFAHEHPGGAMPLKNLAGMSCSCRSWSFYKFSTVVSKLMTVPGQFHKIHSNKTLEAYGSRLRIGRTTGVPNPHKQPRAGLIRQLWQSYHF